MSKRALAVFIASFLTVLAHYSIRYSYGTLLPGMLPALDISKAEAGVIYSSYFMTYMLFSPIMGSLSDKYDMRLIISAFVTLMGAGAFLMQFPTELWQACLFFAITGIGCAACWAPIMALSQRWTSDKKRGLSLALVDAGSTIGVMAAGVVVPMLIAESGWRFGWQVLGIFAMCLGVVNYFLIRDRPASSATAAIEKEEWKKHSGITPRQLLSDRRFWLIGLAYLLVGVSIQIPFTFLSTYAVQELRFSYETATRLITLIGAAGLVGKLTLGPLSDKIGRIRIMALCSILIMAGCLGIAFSQGWIFFLLTFIFGIGYGACWSLYAACAADFFAKESSGTIIGLWTVYLGIGLTLSPVVAGWTADITGTLRWAFVISAISGLGTTLLLLPLLKRKR
jgi:MFS family permease